jgi:hypothetical protein
MPHATCRVPLPPGAFPSRQPDATRRHAVPSCRCCLTCQKPSGRNPLTPFDETARLQGFAPPESPFLPVRCYSFQQADPLMGFLCPLPGFPAPCRVSSALSGEAAPLMPLVVLARSPTSGFGPEGLRPAQPCGPFGPELQRIAGQGAWPLLFPDATYPPEVCPPSC